MTALCCGEPRLWEWGANAEGLSRRVEGCQEGETIRRRGGGRVDHESEANGQTGDEGSCPGLSSMPKIQKTLSGLRYSRTSAERQTTNDCCQPSATRPWLTINCRLITAVGSCQPPSTDRNPATQCLSGVGGGGGEKHLIPKRQPWSAPFVPHVPPFQSVELRALLPNQGSRPAAV